ncbi:3'(2'),5'-bisphosphate nucleotidase CysQ [Limibacter armeniacum]|uniref:3'(2'),5'-bisphosphate nucleotidase CysQ n=1 Tax=Limibacter armeniacum TaxID=466084 RepID=UPI002FE62205
MNIEIESIIEIAEAAGQAIMNIYDDPQSDFGIEKKDDNSPLTKADKAAHVVIEKALVNLSSNIPVLSEEGGLPDYETRKNWTQYWMVDPLDGTKEFIKKNGEFTVNIALIENNLPVMGVVHVPAKGITYYAEIGMGSFKRVNGEDTQLFVRKATENIVAVRSKSHAAPEEEEVLARYNVSDSISVGSSLKFCMVAEGKADVYYRHGPTMEWDTAAGQAVVMAAGGKVYKGNTEEELFTYTKENLLNSSFLCLGL